MSDTNTQLLEEPKAQLWRMECKADGGDYFKIWIVNSLLLLVTLGIYYPWAKVRTTRYLFAHTYLNNEPFEYHATAKQILKGFLLFYVLFVIWVVFGSNPVVAIVLAALAAVGMPFLLVQSMKFKAVMTSYRGVRFGFRLGVGSAYLKCFLALLICVCTFGLALPWVLWRLNHITVDRLVYGDQDFECKGTFWNVFKAYSLSAFIVISGLVLIVVLVGIVFGLGSLQDLITLVGSAISTSEEAMPNQPSDGEAAMGLFFLFFFFFLFACVKFLIKPILFKVKFNELWGKTHVGENQIHTSLTFFKVFKVILLNSLLSMITLGFYYPFAVINILNVCCNAVTVDVPHGLSEVQGQRNQKNSAFGEASTDYFDVGGVF